MAKVLPGLLVPVSQGRPPARASVRRTIDVAVACRLDTLIRSALHLPAEASVDLSEWVSMDSRAVPHRVSIVVKTARTRGHFAIDKAPAHIDLTDVRAASGPLVASARMQVGKGQAVDLDYVLRDVDGNILDGTAASGPVTYIHGNGDLIPGLERHLEGMRSGDEFDVTLEPQDGFGERDDSLTFEVPRHQLGPDIKPRKGMILTMEGPDGSDDPVTIVQVKPNSIVMDGNHPLAGINLRFKGKVVAVRKATQADQHSCCTPAGCTANTH